MDWTECNLVERVPGKVSGAAVLVGTRLPVEALTENYDAFLDEGLTPEQALTQTHECYPETPIQLIQAVLRFRSAHELQPQS